MQVGVAMYYTHTYMGFHLVIAFSELTTFIISDVHIPHLSCFLISLKHLKQT